MARKKELSNDLKLLIFKRLKSGISQRKVAQIFGCAQSTICKIRKKYRSRNYVRNLLRNSRPRLVNWSFAIFMRWIFLVLCILFSMNAIVFKMYQDSYIKDSYIKDGTWIIGCPFIEIVDSNKLEILMMQSVHY